MLVVSATSQSLVKITDSTEGDGGRDRRAEQDVARFGGRRQPLVAPRCRGPGADRRAGTGSRR